VEKGGDVNARTADGKTALKIAVEKGNKEVVECLKAHGAK
jgi:ankyrin repeat protein